MWVSCFLIIDIANGWLYFHTHTSHTQLVSLERMVFDALGRMWITLFINGVTAFATLICIVGTLCKKKVAIIAVSDLNYLMF